MQSWPERYDEKARAQKSVLCVGLDLEPDHVPPGFGEGIDAMLDYARKVVDAAAVLAPVVKPQLAFWQAMGPHGIRALIQLVEYAHDKELLVILDAKPNDIGNTMRAYGKFVFAVIDADTCTVNTTLGPTFMPLLADLGKEGKSQIWLPWLAEGRCAIAMVRTSNPDADQIQMVELGNGLLFYQYMANLVCDWNEIVVQATGGMGAVGGVVGATQKEAEDCRERMGDIFALIPGYGAQGGGAEGAVVAIPGPHGDLRGVVNSSRGITLQSWRGKDGPKPGDPIEHVIAAIDAANDELNAALKAKLGRDPYQEQEA